MTSFKVVYKNGNVYELFLDSREPAAGRMLNGADPSPGQPRRLDDAPGMRLVLGYPSPEVLKPKARGANGKFRANSSASGRASS